MEKDKKFVKGLIFGGVILLIVAPILFLPKPVHAQWLTTDIPHLMMQVGKWIGEQGLRLLDIAYRQGAAIFFKNVLPEFLNRVAVETATFIGSGFKEGKPLFFFEKDYWKKLGDSTAGEFLDRVAKDFIGQGLCEPIDPTIKLNILLSLPVPKPPQPFVPEARCSFSDIKKNLSEAAKKQIAQISIRIQEGPAKFSVQLKTMIDIGKFAPPVAKLIKDSMDTFDKLKEKIDEYGKLINGIAEKAKELQMGTAESILKLNEAELNKLEREIGLLANDFEGQSKKLEEIFKECSGLSVSAFCSRENCYSFCPRGTIGYECGDPTFKQCQEKFNENKKWYEEAISQYNDLLLSYATLKENKIKLANLPSVPAGKILEDFQKKLLPEANPLGQIGVLASKIKSKVSEIVESEKFQQALRGEWKAPESIISGIAKYPGGITEEQAREMVRSGTASERVYTGVAIADAIGLFVNTLSAKLQRTLMNIGMNILGGQEKTISIGKTWEELFKKAGQQPPGTLGGGGVGGGTGGGTGPVIRGGYAESPLPRPKPEEIKAIYAEVLTTPIKKGEIIRLVDEFAQCPSDPRFTLPNQCVIDTAFAQAIEQELTIEEAMKKNLLHPEWYVGSPNTIDTKRDFASRYSLTNARILVRAGIMPLGFEIAAEEATRIGEATGQKFTLKEIVDGFNQAGKDGKCGTRCGNDKVCGNSDDDVDESPFCNLVNPKWRLKSFPALCELIGYTAIPQPNSAERQEACLQWRTCTGENEDGTCHTFNYCTAYRNSWRFNADRCEAQYDSCQLYTRTRDKAKFAFLEKTLDKNCDANSVGCTWYCQKYNPQLGNSGMWSCAGPGKKYSQCTLSNKCTLSNGCPCPSETNRLCVVPNGSTYCFYEENDPYNVIFFNRLVESCDKNSEGCTQFIRTKENLGTNLLPNGSFENYTGEETNPNVLGWQFSTGEAPPARTGKFVFNEAKAYSGKIYALFTELGTLLPDSSIFPNIYFLKDTKYTISFYVKNEDQNNDRNLTFKIEGTNISKTWTINKNSDWQFLSFEFNLEPESGIVSPISINGIRFISSGENLALDNLQLETGSVSSYKEYGTVNNIYLKKAPEWMKCYDDDLNNDDPNCINFVKKCSQADVGCEKYTPVFPGPYLPAVAKEKDFCPAECVGYEYFKEKPTNFYPEDEASFIPKTARTCPASEVGCEGFTNLEEVARGGEGREYYSFLRACQKPDGDCAYFYTWIGSETKGYELKRYSLRKKTDGTPFEIFDKETAERIWGKCENAEDARINPYCKEFYNEAGNISYVLYPNTVVCTTNCVRLRKNKPISPAYCWPNLFEDKNPVNNRPIIPGLSYVGNENEGICTFMADLSESVKCSASNEGCREYKGNNANNIKISFFDDFEYGSYYPWEKIEGSDLSYTNESIYFGGHSLKITPSTTVPPPQGQSLLIKKVNAQVITSFGAQRPVSNLVFQNRSYLVSFLVKPTTFNQSISVKFTSTDAINISLGKEWQLINVGPFFFTLLPSPDEKLIISSNNAFYLDNVQVKDTGSLYLIKDSWFTPYSCDNEFNDPYGKKCGGREDEPKRCHLGAMIGCNAYRDRENKIYYLKSFSRLCQEEFVGCEALINTHNSTSPFKEEFNRGAPSNDEVLVPADELEYLVFDKKFSCNLNDKGCQRFGLPHLVNDKPTIYEDVYLKNNPDLYESRPILCQANQLNCEEFTVAGGGSVYFKDPGEKLCEWREKTGEREAGWYKVGTNLACYPDYKKGFYYDIRYFGDPNYQGYAGLCPEKEAGCSKFTDPLSTAQMNYIQNGGFDEISEDLSKGPAKYWVYGREGCDSTYCKRVENEGSPQPSLLIDVDYDNNQPGPQPRPIPQNSVRLIYNVYQEIKVEEKAGQSYLLEFEGKIDSLANFNEAGALVQLTYQGAKSVGEWNECPEGSSPECDWWQDYRSNCQTESGCRNWLRKYPPAQPYNCQFNRRDPGRCIAWMIEAGFKPWANGDGLSDWAANFEYGYITSTRVNLDPKKQGWQKASLMIESGGDLNPRGLPLKSVFVHAILSPPRWDSCDLGNNSECDNPWPSNGQPPWKCCSAAGKVYFDNFQLRPFEPYYLLDNYKLEKGACNGLVSLEEGCVLFRDEKIKENYYNSIATYAKSKDLKGALVKPVDCSKPPFNLPPTQTQPSRGISWLKKIFSFLFKTATAQTQTTATIPSCDDPPYKDTDYCKYCFANGQTKNDTNLILKVSSTRVCGEWLHCEKFEKIWQKEINDYIEICKSGSRCRRQIGQGKESTCAEIVQTPNEVLTKQKYQERDISWFGLEPAGFSLYEMRPLEHLSSATYNIIFENTSIPGQMVLTSFTRDNLGNTREEGVTKTGCKTDSDCPAGAICATGCGGYCVEKQSGQGGNCSSYTSEEQCRSDNNCKWIAPYGYCPSDATSCDGQCKKDGKIFGRCVIPLTTQAYPEKDAPFRPQASEIFPNINVCERGVIDCSKFNTKEECEAPKIKINGRDVSLCYWNKVSDNQNDQTYECLVYCGIFQDQQSCERYKEFHGCTWWENRCVTIREWNDPQGQKHQNGCARFDNEEKCLNESYGACWWWNGGGGVERGCYERCCNCIDKVYCDGDPRIPDHPNCGLDPILNRCRVTYPVVIEKDEEEPSWNYFACQISYRKAEYGTGGQIKKYFNISPLELTSWPGVCMAGDKEKIGKICQYDTDCGKDTGHCALLTKETIYRARNNFCLLQDTSRPKDKNGKEVINACLIWYPFIRILQPIVETRSATGVSATTATLHGFLSSLGAASAAKVWFEYGTDPQNLIKVKNPDGSDWEQLINFPGTSFNYTFPLHRLSPNTTYYFRAGAENVHGSSYGNVLSFTTTERPPFDFTLSCDPSQDLIPPGNNTTFTLKVENVPSEAERQTVTFSFSVQPPQDGNANDITFNPAQPSCSAGNGQTSCNVTVTVSASGNAQVGDYQITITGTAPNGKGGNVSKSTIFTLTVGGVCEGTQKSCWENSDCTRQDERGNNVQFSCIDAREGRCQYAQHISCKDDNTCNSISCRGDCEQVGNKWKCPPCPQKDCVWDETERKWVCPGETAGQCINAQPGRCGQQAPGPEVPYPCLEYGGLYCWSERPDLCCPLNMGCTAYH